MKTCLFPSLILIAILLGACAPAAATGSPAAPAVVELSATPFSEPTLEIVSVESTPPVDLTATYTLQLLSATPPVGAQPIATSRGPELEATDPTTVNLASGQAQFVEFFRFT